MISKRILEARIDGLVQRIELERDLRKDLEDKIVRQEKLLTELVHLCGYEIEYYPKGHYIIEKDDG